MYKYCIVPKCTNTTFKTPEKLFFNVPKDPKLRKKWYAVVKRDDKTPPSFQATRHCCEDHFDVETDMENYVKYKLVGGRIKLKPGIVPHKFKCQENKEDNPDTSSRKRDQKVIRKKLLIKEEKSITDDEDDETDDEDDETDDDEEDDDITEETEELFVPSYIDDISTEDPLSLENNGQCLINPKRSIGVQVNLHENNDRNLTILKKNKGVQCNMQNLKRKVYNVSTITDETFNI